MGRHGQSAARLYRGARIENQEHLIAASEEHMAAFFRGIALETEDVLIEMARRGEIVRIESRFQYPGGAQDNACCCKEMSSAIPDLARSSISKNLASAKGSPSAVAWISTMPPVPVATKLASVSAAESSA